MEEREAILTEKDVELMVLQNKTGNVPVGGVRLFGKGRGRREEEEE